MTLAPGTRLGPYEIIAPVGAGGMGEVYRARDGRLQRDVAVKLLPAALAGDAEALRRLEQEARTLAALRHPNLLTIYDFGAAADGSPFLVCELLQGETLRARLQSGRLPWRDAVAFGIGIAHGLAAAHSRGVVHRDLKPENLFCTEDGRITILDFGLARLAAPHGAEAQTLSPGAAAAVATEAGVTLGTLGYMAPEQARGQVADARSDIFSLGAVLYEMFSGRRAFHGDTPADTLSAILREEPPELELENSPLAAPLNRIVRHCLEKLPARRFQSADDLGFALESLDSLHSSSILPALAPPVNPFRARLGRAALIAAAMVLVAAATWFATGRRDATPPPRFQRISYKQGKILSGAFLPNGSGAMFTAVLAPDLKLRDYFARLDGPGLQDAGAEFDHVLATGPGVAAVMQNFVNVRAFQNQGTLALMPLSGGAPRPLLDHVEDAAFAPGGNDADPAAALVIVRFHPDSRISTLEYPVGKVLAQTDGWFSTPRVSRDGRRLAFLEHPTPGDDAGQVVIMDVAGHVLHRGPAFASAQGLAWSPTDAEVWYTASLSSIDRDVYALSLSGQNRLLLTGTSSFVLLDVLPDGRALLSSDTLRASALVVTPDHPEPRDFSVFDWADISAVSADGKDFLIGDENAGPRYAAFLAPAAGTPPVHLGDGDPMDLSSDDAWALSLVPTQGGTWQMWLLPTGAGSPRPLTHGAELWNLASFVPGRQLVVADGNEPGRPRRSFLVDWQGAVHPLTPEGTAGDLVTPDGQFVLTSNANRDYALYPLAGGAPRPISLQFDSPAPLKALPIFPLRFGSDNATLYGMRRLPNAAIQVLRLNLNSHTEQLLFTLSNENQPGVALPVLQGISADGRSYIYRSTSQLSTLYIVTGLH